VSGGSTATGTRAVVMGASIAGLAVARALASHFAEVVVVERDALPDGPTPRRGVPQDRHIHLLLAAGVRALEALFPGLLDDLAAAGAPRMGVDRARLCFNGHRLASPTTAEQGIAATRPFLEWHVRQRVIAQPGVRLYDQEEVVGLVTGDDPVRVLGARVRGRGDAAAERTERCELVVDCSGRRSAVPRWLEQLGFAAPSTDEVPVDVHYRTHLLEHVEDQLDGAALIAVGPTSVLPRGGVVMRVEGGRALATVYGLCGERPPGGLEQLEGYASDLPIGDVARVIRAGEPVGQATSYRFPANRRRRYEHLDDLPSGLLVAGDAVCSFNPIYGQGMTVAALEAVILRGLLGEEGVPSPQRWFAAIGPVVDGAWTLATGSDLAVSCVSGTRTRATRWQHGYVERLHAAARHDPVLTDRFFRVSGLTAPPSLLLRPGTLARVARGNVGRRRRTRTER
jgi:2-polyprenyl-6-methoxyphenol hydroxylase-like FAD-dependent oxidoreductase